mmetsp:Transcript_37157/g.85859  ORF Transcript_37157/g.85859 Transcript_37157/m.85859 type:complete len:435 (-) Transcript_37157:1223-2527(-)
MLSFDGPLILHRLCSGQVVQPKCQAVAVRGLPICNIITMKILCLLLANLEILLQECQGIGKTFKNMGGHRAPPAVPPQYFQGVLATHFLHVFWVHFAVITILHLLEIHLLRVLYPLLEKAHHIFLVGVASEIGDFLNCSRELHEHDLLFCSVAFIHKGNMVAARTTLWHASNSPNNIPQDGALVLSGTGNGNNDVPQLFRELWMIPPVVRVGRENARTKHDRLDAEANDQNVAEQPHRGGLVLLISYVTDQRILFDVATGGTVCHWSLIWLASMGTPTRYGHTSIIERRRSSLLTCLEACKATLVESAVHCTCNKIKWSLPSVTPTWFDFKPILLVEGHGVLTHWVLDWSKLLIILRCVLLHKWLSVRIHCDWRLCQAVVVFVQLLPNAALIPRRLENEHTRLAEHISARRNGGSTDAYMEAWKGSVNSWRFGS